MKSNKMTFWEGESELGTTLSNSLGYKATKGGKSNKLKGFSFCFCFCIFFFKPSKQIVVICGCDLIGMTWSYLEKKGR